MIVPHAQIREEVLGLHKTGGLPRGALTGWPSLDKHYTVAGGQWTLVTGVPHSGKSEFVDALMVNLAMAGDWHFYIFSPENWPLALHHSKIIEKYTGKPFNPGPTPWVNEDDLNDAEAWMEDKFYFCKPTLPSIHSILTESIVAEPMCAIPRPWKLGVVIDPWNQLEHERPPSLSETEYVSRELSNAIHWVRSFDAHLFLIAHPAKMFRDRDGKYPIPTPRDVSGSAHWWAKADNCLTVHRDQANGSQEVEIHVQKVRFRHIGRVGMVTLNYDRVTGKYHEKPTSKATVKPIRSYADKDD